MQNSSVSTQGRTVVMPAPLYPVNTPKNSIRQTDAEQCKSGVGSLSTPVEVPVAMACPPHSPPTVTQPTHTLSKDLQILGNKKAGKPLEKDFKNQK